jgi:hypothetical protein
MRGYVNNSKVTWKKSSWNNLRYYLNSFQEKLRKSKEILVKVAGTLAPEQTTGMPTFRS